MSPEMERVRELQRQLDDLRRTLAESATLDRAIRPVLEEYLEKSLLARSARRLLIGAIVAGIVVWSGGAISNGIQIKSLLDQSRETKQKVDEEIKTMTAEVQQKVHRLDDDVVKHSKAIDASAAVAITDIQGQKREAARRLDLTSIPDIRSLNGLMTRTNQQVRALQQSKGTVNLDAFSVLSGYAVGTIVTAVVLSFLLSLAATLLLFNVWWKLHKGQLRSVRT